MTKLLVSIIFVIIFGQLYTQTNCILKLGNLEFPDCKPQYETFINDMGFTKKKTIPCPINNYNKTEILNSVYGQIIYTCGTTYRIRSFDLFIQGPDSSIFLFQNTYLTDRITQNDTITNILNTTEIRIIYIDNIVLSNGLYVKPIALKF